MSIVSIIIIVATDMKFGVTISITLLAVVVLMIIGMAVRKGGKKMFNWISSLFAGAALDMAIYSAGLASANGMHQMKEPEGLQKLAEESKKSKTAVK